MLSIRRSNLCNCLKILSTLIGTLVFHSTGYATNLPRVEYVKGEVTLSSEGSKAEPLKAGKTFSVKTKIITGKKSEVKVILDSERFVILREKSELSFPYLNQETGQVPVINFARGELYISQGKSYNLAISNALQEFITPPGRYILGMDPSVPLAYVKVLEGNFEFTALNFEHSQSLKAGDLGKFQGVLEDNEIAYDVLLKGKKIPKGKLLSISKVDADDMSLYSPAAIEAEKKRVAAKVQAKQKEKQALEARYVCQKPSAQFNQCYWIKEKSTCFRQRCNANGQWAEKTEITVKELTGQCTKSAFVASCDY